MSDQKSYPTAKDYVSAFIERLGNYISEHQERIIRHNLDIADLHVMIADLCEARDAVRQLLDKEPLCAPSAGTVKDRVLAELNQGPLHYKELTSRLGVYESTITAALSKWHRRGVVEPKGNGVWALK